MNIFEQSQDLSYFTLKESESFWTSNKRQISIQIVLPIFSNKHWWEWEMTIFAKSQILSTIPEFSEQ